MTLSFYDATVPHYLQLLPGVIANLNHAEAWARQKGVPDSQVLATRIPNDKFTLAWHFRMVAKHAGGTMQAIEGGIFHPDLDEAPEDFAILRAMLTDAWDYLATADRAAIDALADRHVDFVMNGKVMMRFTGANFILSFARSVFAFHAGAAHSILLGMGADVKKVEHLGQMAFRPELETS